MANRQNKKTNKVEKAKGKVGAALEDTSAGVYVSSEDG